MHNKFCETIYAKCNNVYSIHIHFIKLDYSAHASREYCRINFTLLVCFFFLCNYSCEIFNTFTLTLHLNFSFFLMIYSIEINLIDNILYIL